MFDSGSSSFASAISANAPNQSMMFMMYSAVFGNMAFTTTPANPGTFQAGYTTIPYQSLEAYLYNAQMSNPIVAPTNITSGATGGTQNISGTQIVTDSTGNQRVAIGNVSTTN